MKRKALQIIVLLALIGRPAGAACAQLNAQLPPPPQPPPQTLMLTASIVSSQYCAGNKLDILQMRLRLQYKNITNQKVILYTGKNLFYQTKLRLVSTDPSINPYEVVVLNSVYRDEVTEAIDKPSPGKAFVMLPPGAVYETGMVVGAGVVGPGVSRTFDTLVPGEHTLQIIASTWYESRKLGEELRRRWQPRGLLVIDPLGSKPQKFLVERNHSTAVCR